MTAEDDHIDGLTDDLLDAIENRNPDAMKYAFDLLLDAVQTSADEEEEDGEQISGEWRPNKVIIIEPPDWA